MNYSECMSKRRIRCIAFLLFIVVGFSIYSNSFDVPFIFDDSDNIQNPSLRLNELSPDALLKAAVESNILKRPVANISFAFNYYFGEYNVRGYHLVNILIHVVASFFLFILLSITLELPVNREKYRSGTLLPLLAALLWLTHPLATQSVTYLVQRMNSLAAMFYVLSVLCYVQGRICESEDGTQRQKSDRLLWFACSLISGILALASKEIAVTLPFVVFLYEWFFLQNLSWKWLKKKIPWIVALLAFLYCASYFFLGGNPFQRVLNSCNNRPFSSLERVLTELRVVMHYIGLLVYPNPSRLVFDYNFPLSTSLFSPISTIISLVSLSLIAGVAGVIAKKERFIAFCIFWFFINLILESSVICLEIIFEHRTYLPSMFLLAIVPVLFYRIGLNKSIATGILVLSLTVLGYWTLERNKVWQNDIRFWQDSVDKQPLKARAHNNLGVALYNEKKFEEAEDAFIHALSLLPDFPEAYSNLGLVQYRQHRMSDAEKNFNHAIALRSHYIEARLNLASFFKDQGKYDKALTQYRALYARIPEYSIINKEMGQVLLRIGQPEEALVYLEKAYKKLPKDTFLLLDRGEAFMKTGKFAEARRSYLEVTDIDEGNTAAHYNLGLLLNSAQKQEEALVHYRRVELSRSSDVPVLYNLGNLYLRLGLLEEAKLSYTKFLESTAVIADAFNNLGLVYVRKNELSKAMENFQAALRINPGQQMAAQNLFKVQQELHEKEENMSNSIMKQ